MTIRIGIDAHVIDGKSQGSKTTLTQLFNAVARQKHNFHFCFYSYEPDAARRAIADGKADFKPLRWKSAFARQCELVALFRRDKIDFGLFQYIAPIFSKNTIVVIHDILPITHKRFFPFLFRLRAVCLFSLSIMRARLILTVSETTRKEVIRVFPRVGDKVFVVRNGPSFPLDTYFAQVPPDATANAGRPFILTVGRIELRRNIPLLVEAFLEAEISDVDLVIVGNYDLGYRYRPKDNPRIHILTGVSDETLISLYRRAALFVYPSSAEGFGIPLLDATLFGLPTLSSNLTAMPEVGGDLVDYFDPTAPLAAADLAQRLHAHFHDRPINAPSDAARRRQAERFSWDTAAKNFLATLGFLCGADVGDPR